MIDRRAVCGFLVIFVALAASSCGASVDEPSLASSKEAVSSAQAPSVTEMSPVFVVGAIDSNRFFVYQSVALDRPSGAVWEDIDDFERIVRVALPESTDFQWIDGRPRRVPSTVQFALGEDTIVEQITEIDPAERELRYHVVNVPVLGIASFEGTISLLPVCNNRTSLVYERAVTLNPGVDLNGLLPLFQQEMVNMKQHYARRTQSAAGASAAGSTGHL